MKSRQRACCTNYGGWGGVNSAQSIYLFLLVFEMSIKVKNKCESQDHCKNQIWTSSISPLDVRTSIYILVLNVMKNFDIKNKFGCQNQKVLYIRWKKWLPLLNSTRDQAGCHFLPPIYGSENLASNTNLN